MILKEIMHFHYMTYGHMHPSTRIPAPRVMKIIILVDPSLVIITNTYIVCLIYAWE